MRVWLAVRIFLAFFLTLFGVSVILNPAGSLIGSAVASVGLTFLCLLWLEARILPSS